MTGEMAMGLSFLVRNKRTTFPTWVQKGALFGKADRQISSFGSLEELPTEMLFIRKGASLKKIFFFKFYSQVFS